MYSILAMLIVGGFIFIIFKNPKPVDFDITLNKWEKKFNDKGFTFKKINIHKGIKVRDLFDQFGCSENRRCIDIGGRLIAFSFGYKDGLGRSVENKNLTSEIIDKLYSVLLKGEGLKEILINEYGIDKANNLLNKKYSIGETTKEEILSVRGDCRNVKNEQLKTKLKTTLYYGPNKTSDFYVFDNGVLTKFVDKLL